MNVIPMIPRNNPNCVDETGQSALRLPVDPHLAAQWVGAWCEFYHSDRVEGVEDGAYRTLRTAVEKFPPSYVFAVSRMTKSFHHFITMLSTALQAHADPKAVEHESLGPAVALPYRREGKAYAWKFRGVERKDWRSTQGVSRGLFNEDALREGDGPIVITEGEIDALSVIQAGYSRAVSLPDGWTEDGGKRQILIDVEKLLRKAEFVIVASDADKVGAGLPRTVANILLGHDVRYVDWPEGCKDANDVLVAHGEGRIVQCLSEAKRVDPPGGFITGLLDLPPLPPRRVLRIGMAPYDYGIAFEVGTLSVGTGTPGAGKSTFTTFAAYQVAQHEKVRVAFLAFETSAQRIRDQLCRLHGRKPFDDMGRDEQLRVLTELHPQFRIVHRTYEEGTQHHLPWLRSMIYTLAVRDNCKLIIVDPWNELEHLPEAGESMADRVGWRLHFALFFAWPVIWVLGALQKAKRRRK